MSAEEDIVVGPADILSTVCEPVSEITPEIKSQVKKMLENMYEAEGVGLAAPQIGVNNRVVVIDCDYDGEHNRCPYVLINPEIKVADGPMRTTCEGCLSFPGLVIEIERPSHVIVEALNLDGDLMRYEAENNLMAVCLQHEIDHLNGITMFDHLGPLARAKKMREYKEALQEGARPGDTTH